MESKQSPVYTKILQILTQNSNTKSESLPSRLRSKGQWWTSNGDNYTRQLIRAGVRLELICGKRFSELNKTNSKKLARCDQWTSLLPTINDYQKSGAVGPIPRDKVKFTHHCFGREKKESGSIRMITNCKELNGMCPTPPHFKLDTLSETLPRLRVGMYMCKIDIKDAYFHVPLSKSSVPWFALQMTPEEGEVLAYNALPFGWSWSPYLFQRVLRQTLRAAKVSSFAAYLDNILIWGETYENCLTNTLMILQTLNSAGWLINQKKSQFLPSQEMDFLGVNINTLTMKIHVEKKSIQRYSKEQNVHVSGIWQ